jgi:hypothetical protein
MGLSHCACAVGIESAATVATTATAFCVRIFVHVQARNAALLQGLGGLGWIVGRNVRIEHRWAAGNSDLYRRYAEELVALAPDILVGSGASAAIALQRTSRTVPPTCRMPLEQSQSIPQADPGRKATPRF